jgi:aminoglycoside/choline kinase family phosphotransferase
MAQSDSLINIDKILKELYRNSFKQEAVSAEPVYSHGSDRNIFRIQSQNNNPIIGIYNSNKAENNAFIEFSKHFKNNGLNVPEIYAVSGDLHAYLMEDLGDITLFKKICDDKERFSRHNIGLYKHAIESLVKFQLEAGKEINYSLCYQFNEFGKDNIEFDLNYFKQRFLDNFYMKEPNSERLEIELDFLKLKLLELPRDYFLYRDFQSRNIMHHKNDLYYIDYQSGRKGALQYDISSLMYDAKADIPQDLREYLLEYYIKEVKKYTGIDANDFKHYFWYFAMIRILQAMGAYGFLGITKGKKRFLESIPYALKNINFILNNRINKTEFGYLKTIFSEIKYDKS